MAKDKKRGMRSMAMLRLVMGKLKRGLLPFIRPPLDDDADDDEFNEGVGDAMDVPEDVKEGQFAVFAVDVEIPKRFIVELSCLTNPEFLKLLEQAEEEFGFEQKGALAIPCGPDDLQRVVLGGGRKVGSGGGVVERAL